MRLYKDLINGLTFIPGLYRDKERKSIFTILKEFLSLAIKNKTLPSYYLSRHLYKNRVNNIHDYIPNNVLMSLSDLINDKEASRILSNKLFFFLLYSKFYNNLAKVLVYNHKNVFVMDSKFFTLNSVSEFESLLIDLVNNKSLTESIFIKKTYNSHGGANTYRVKKSDFPLKKDYVEALFSIVIKSAYVFQETIIQHEELNRLNPSCINTIRMDTFTDKDGKIEIIGPYLRMSINNLHVDNTSSGGCCVGIDLESGKLLKYGYTSISRTGGMILTSHPITHVEFQNYEIPYFSETKQFVLHVASIVPNLRLIGWDIAITKTGPLLIEGNCGYDITNHDLIFGGYKRNPVFKKVLQELNLL